MRVANNTEWLFFHLWKKNPETMLPCLNLNVAETIIFRWAQPYFWYYTAKDGMIVRKTKEKILMQNIEDSFLNNLPKCEVVAKTLTSLEDPNLKLQEKIEFEYIPKVDFHDFLFQREKSHNVIIQKFIEPKNGVNALIKVAWTPQFCLFFRKTNVNDINNSKVPILNRLVTFEGLEHLSTSDSISSPILASELEQTCLNIVKHIHSVTSGNVQISKMTLYFKLDDKNRLWLLFCTGLKLREKLQNPSAGLSFKKKTERPASPIMVVTTKKDKETSKPKVPVQYLLEDQINQVDDNICLRCSKEDLLYDIKLKHVLDHEEKILKGLRTQDLSHVEDLDADDVDPFYGGLLAPEKGRANIPAVMKKLYPTLTEERYHKLKKNVSLMNMMVKICESCYLVITENILANADEKKAKKIGTQLKDNVKKEDDYFGFGSLSGGKKGTTAPQPGFEKSGKAAAHQVKTVIEQEYNNPVPTESDMGRSKRFSKADSSHKEEFQPDPKPIKISVFSSAKKVQHAKKSSFGGSGSLPQIGVPDASDYKPIESSPQSDFYGKDLLTQGSSVRSKSFVPPLRQVRSPYANGLVKEENFDSRGNRTTDQTKKVVFPRPPLRDKTSMDFPMKNSMSGVWRNNQVQTPHRTNFSSMMSAIKDLKNVLGEIL